MRQCDRCKKADDGVHHLEVGRFFADEGGEYCVAGDSCAACAAEIDALIVEAVQLWKLGGPQNFSLSCTQCDAGVQTLLEAVKGGWREIEYDPDGSSWVFLGLCPECHRKDAAAAIEGMNRDNAVRLAGSVVIERAKAAVEVNGFPGPELTELKQAVEQYEAVCNGQGHEGTQARSHEVVQAARQEAPA